MMRLQNYIVRWAVWASVWSVSAILLSTVSYSFGQKMVYPFSPESALPIREGQSIQWSIPITTEAANAIMLALNSARAARIEVFMRAPEVRGATFKLGASELRAKRLVNTNGTQIWELNSDEFTQLLANSKVFSFHGNMSKGYIGAWQRCDIGRRACLSQMQAHGMHLSPTIELRVRDERTGTALFIGY